MGNTAVVADEVKSHTEPKTNAPGIDAGGLGSISLGILVAGLFYAAVFFSPWQPLHRYFLGHPVAIAATVLFWVAAATLMTRWISTATQWRFLKGLRDSDLVPTPSQDSPTEQFQTRHDVRHVAAAWLESLDQLPAIARQSKLIVRLREVLLRQHRRGTSKHLADDLRELSARDADDAHDSFGLVRIIVWAIPMLGFLGTVIGITQTLGGLDFTDGTAAVDRLKSGLYVAFDTTALGLVLSVIAIFLQFPVERNVQRLLAAIDDRVDPLLSAAMPHDEQGDDPTQLIVRLCDGIRTAVAESLANQTQLWRKTIDEANQHWETVHESDADRFSEAVQATLMPALREHAGALDESIRFAGDRLERSAEEWQGTLESSFDRLLTSHQNATALQQKQNHVQQQLMDQTEGLLQIHRDAETLQIVQATLSNNLQTLAATHQSIQSSVEGAARDGLPDAMRVLARAVDVLSFRLASESSKADSDPNPPAVRRAA